MPWYVVKLDKNDTASWVRIATELEKLYISSGAPKGAALFDNQDATNGCKLYFSPIAAEISNALISELGGSPCEKPTESIVILGRSLVY